MRMFIAGLVATIVLVTSASAPPAGAATIDKGARPGGLVVQPGQIVVQPPEKILVPVPSGPPVNFVRPELPPVLQGGPKPDFYIAPGVEGIYAQLRTPSRTRPVPLAPYEPYRSPATPADPTKFNTRQIVVKFVEGSAIRLRENALVVSGEPTATETSSRLARASLEPPMVQADLDDFSKQVQSFGGIAGRAAPGVEENDLRLLRQAAERNSRAEQPDPNLFYFVFLPELKPEDADRALQTLMKHRIVEVAYFQPIPFNAVDKPPQTTLSVTGSQGYRSAAPVGIDAVFARNFAGGRGEGIRAADIEAVGTRTTKICPRWASHSASTGEANMEQRFSARLPRWRTVWRHGYCAERDGGLVFGHESEPVSRHLFLQCGQRAADDRPRASCR